MKLFEKIKLVIWGFKTITKMNAKYIVYITIESLTSSLVPFVLIYFSSFILDTISNNFDFDKILKYVIIFMVVELFLNGIKEISSAKKQLYQSQWNLKQEEFFQDINNRMPYCEIENPELHLLKNKITSNQNSTGAGLGTQINCYSILVSSVISIVVSICMTIGMFKTIYQTDSGVISLINSRLFLLGFIVLLVIFIWLAVKSNTMKFIKESDEWRSLPESNRLLNYIRKNLSSNLWAMDGRIYKWEDIIISEIKKYTDNPKYIDNIFNIHKKYSKLHTLAKGGVRLLVFLYVGIKVFYKVFSVGKFIQYTGAMEQLVLCVTNFFIYIKVLMNNTVYINDIYEYCNHAEIIEEKLEDPDEGKIEVKDVCYKYSGCDSYALNNINIEFETGKKYAIVGENGSGKTTFVKLLSGLYDPTCGDIYIGKTNVKNVDKKKYYKKFSVVFQDFSLISASVGENIGVNKEYYKEAVLSAISKVGFSERLEKMKNNINTVIYREYDEQGEEISGGEAQKIALARAVYKDSPYIILDEPTAALDSIAEEEIYSRVSEITKDKTVFFVSHRLSSCKFCDEILVFSGGEIIQRGTHDELLKDKNGKYSLLWNAQAQYYVL